jgi:hypothetical protein
VSEDPAKHEYVVARKMTRPYSRLGARKARLLERTTYGQHSGVSCKEQQGKNTKATMNHGDDESRMSSDTR